MAHAPERESWLKMLADALREIGMLYLVFGILDAQIEARRGGTSESEGLWFARVVVISGIIWLVGAVFERLRREWTMSEPYILGGILIAALGIVSGSILLYFDRRKHPDKKGEA